MSERNFTAVLVRGSYACNRLMEATHADVPEGIHAGEKVMVCGYKPIVGGPMDGTVEFQLMRVEVPEQWVDVTTIGSTRRTDMNSRTREVRDAGPIAFFPFNPSGCTHVNLDVSTKRCAGCGLTFKALMELFKALMELGIDTREPVDHPCPAVGGACDVDLETKRCTSCHRTQALIDRLDAGMLPMLGDTGWDGDRPSAPLHRFDLERAPDGSDMALETAQVDKNHPAFIHPRGRINTTVPLPRVYTLTHHVDDMSGDDVAEDVD